MVDPMAAWRLGGHDEAMSVMTLHENPVVDLDRAPHSGRDPAHVAYDHAAALLTSARALEAATRDPGAVPALAPTLACLDVSLDALATAVERLRTHALERLTDPILPAEDMRARRAEIAADLARLAGLLAQGAETTALAQRSLAPVADELTVI
jgi:hypothetical protein